MIDTQKKQNQLFGVYKQQNVYSIISVNCLLDLTLLLYFEKNSNF